VNLTVAQRWCVAAGLAAALSACVHYVPRPRAPARVVTDFSGRSLQDPGLREALDKALAARSADWPRKQWDRADLLFAMLYFNDSLAEGRTAVDVSTAARKTAREYPNPSIELEGEYANQHDGSPLWLWGVATEWLVDFGVRRGMRISVADLTERQALYDFAELAWRTRAALRSALADTLLAQREVTLLESVRADRDSQLEMARRQLEVGAAARGELDRLVSDALLDEQRLNDARRRASAAQSALAAAVGVSVQALERVHLSWADLENPPDIPQDRLDQARQEALLERGDVRSAVTAYGVAEAALRLEVSKQYPDVAVGPAYQWDHGVKRLQFNLFLTLPLLNRNQGAIAQAEAQRAQAGAKLEATVAAAFAQIDEGIRQWHLARARLAEAHSGIYVTAQRIYSEVERGFAAGANDRTELVAARIARTLAELQVLEAVRGAQEALAGLEDAMRRPLEGPELSLDPMVLAAPEGRR
jgi:outer membrane protein, heavy metal efflux system